MVMFAMRRKFGLRWVRNRLATAMLPVLLAACGEKQISFAFLRQAVAGNYCAHQALQSDPLLAGVRGDAEFHQIVQAAADCQKKFAAAQESGR